MKRGESSTGIYFLSAFPLCVPFRQRWPRARNRPPEGDWLAKWTEVGEGEGGEDFHIARPPPKKQTPCSSHLASNFGLIYSRTAPCLCDHANDNPSNLQTPLGSRAFAHRRLYQLPGGTFARTSAL